MQVVIEAHEAGNRQSLFRVLLDGKLLGADLTAAQAHGIAGDAIEAFVQPKGRAAAKTVVKDGQTDGAK